MEYIGRVNNKETLAGDLEDGRRVYVQALSVFDAAPGAFPFRTGFRATLSREAAYSF